MNAKEALQSLDAAEPCPRHDAWLVARDALREKVEREEAKEPKRRSLEGMEERIRNGLGDGTECCGAQPCCGKRRVLIVEICDTFRLLREEIVPYLEYQSGSDWTNRGPAPMTARGILRKLGVTP